MNQPTAFDQSFSPPASSQASSQRSVGVTSALASAARALPRPPGAEELGDVAKTIAWMRGLRQLPVSRALPLLLLHLDALTRVEIDPLARLELLRVLKRPVLKAAATLPSPDPRQPCGGLDSCDALTLEQRLDEGMRRNFKLLFQTLDRHRFSLAVATDVNRAWALRSLFKFMRRQVRYALLARRQCPPGTWHDIHDLFVYLVIRGHLTLNEPARTPGVDAGFDAETEYKRLLLMGRCAQLDLPGEAILALVPQLTAWSRASRLIEPEAQVGTFQVLLVEVSQDQALQHSPAGVDHLFRGWVLQPPDAFERFVQTASKAVTPLPAVRGRALIGAARRA